MIFEIVKSLILIITGVGIGYVFYPFFKKIDYKLYYFFLKRKFKKKFRNK